MNITSIDNVYEDDGLTQVYGFLEGLNAEKLDDPLRRQLVAILPEYREDGKLDRLDFITVPAIDPGGISGGLGKLLEGAAEIIARRKAQHAEAVRKLEENPIHVVKGTDSK